MGVRERKWKQHESTIVALHHRCVARLQLNGRRFQKGEERGRKSEREKEKERREREREFKKHKKTIEGGFNDSPIRLNDFLRKTEFWREEDIINRAKKDKAALLRNAKLRLSNIHPGRLLMNLRGQNKWIK